MKNKKLLWLVCGLVIFTSLGLTIMVKGDFNNRRPTPSPTPTSTGTSTASVTPPADEGYVGVMNMDAECFDWDYKVQDTFALRRVVHVLGMNQTGTWYMVRGLASGDSPCWVRAVFVDPDNFEPAKLQVITPDFPPATPTPTTTSTATGTATPSYTPTWILPGATPTLTATPTRTPRTKTPTATPSSTGIIPVSPSFTPTSTATPTHSATPTNTITRTHTPTSTTTASPTNTATKTPTPRPPDPPCIAPETPDLSYSIHGQKVTLSWRGVGADRYEVYKAVEDGAYTMIASTANDSLEDTGLHPNVTYHYYVVAIKSCGEKSVSQVVDVSR